MWTTPTKNAEPSTVANVWPPRLGVLGLSRRVHVPNNGVLGVWVIVIMVQVRGKYMISRYLDPQGLGQNDL